MRAIMQAGLAALLLSGCVTMDGAATAPAADYVAVVADPSRPETDRARDAARLPEELLRFIDIRPGMKVGDFVMGGGYVTRLLSAAVGATGRVYAFQPEEFIAFSAQYGTDLRAVDAAYANVDGLSGPFASPQFPEPLDRIVTVQNFHDLYLRPFPEGTAQRASAALFAALKPGGLLIVIDHSATAGSGTSVADSLHRIEQSAVVAELTAAGFVLDGESAIYARSADPRTANVFSADIRGQTDQFALRFRRPR